MLSLTTTHITNYQLKLQQLTLTNSIEFLTTTKKFYNNGTLVTTTGQQGEYSATSYTVIYRANIGRAYRTLMVSQSVPPNGNIQHQEIKE